MCANEVCENNIWEAWINKSTHYTHYEDGLLQLEQMKGPSMKLHTTRIKQRRGPANQLDTSYTGDCSRDRGNKRD